MQTRSRHQTYADDNKIYANPETQGAQLQEDLDNVALWSTTWMIPLNPDKCTVLHLGKKKIPQRIYTLHGHPLATTTSQVDLGIIIKEDLKWDLQTSAVIKKANSLLYRIRPAFLDIDVDLLRMILTTYVLPLLEYGTPVWSPYLLGDIDDLERILIRASKIPYELRNLPYEERLQRLNLQSLAERREC